MADDTAQGLVAPFRLVAGFVGKAKAVIEPAIVIAVAVGLIAIVFFYAASRDAGDSLFHTSLAYEVLAESGSPLEPVGDSLFEASVKFHGERSAAAGSEASTVAEASASNIPEAHCAQGGKLADPLLHVSNFGVAARKEAAHDDDSSAFSPDASAGDPLLASSEAYHANLL
ncbi:hypothetical protein T492DRAFT_875069 [Pavlovales sp. CCMP2436]|nr:hypothetical protein T492DRAFT_875069 [Pavlovales sp. CCMP2436]